MSEFKPFLVQDVKTQLRIWSREEAINGTLYISHFISNLLAIYEKFLNTPYPLPKLDIVAIPDSIQAFTGNWGLSVFREICLLYDSKFSTIEEKRLVISSISRALVLQWYGGLISPNLWDDVWINEGLASYLQYYGIKQIEPTWNITEEFFMSETFPAFHLDSYLSSKPIVHEVKNVYQARQMFNVLTKSKGASIMRMVKHFLGSSTFSKGIARFLRLHNYSEANTEDLWKAFDQQAAEDGILDGSNTTVGEIMSSWTNQAGFPLLTTFYNKSSKVLTIKQKRFLLTGENDSNNTWYIPISYTTSDRPNFTDTTPKFWIQKEEITSIDLPTSDWHLLNLQCSGYYMVNYDVDNWRKLTRNLLYLPPTTRAQLVGDAMELAKANIIDYDIPFQIIKEIGTGDKDIAFVPLQVTLEKLEYIRDMLINTPAYGLLEVITFHLLSHYLLIFMFIYRNF